MVKKVSGIFQLKEIVSMKHYITLKNQAFAAATAVASILSMWYVLGYFFAVAASKIQFFEIILQYAPQIALMLQFVSPRAWPIDGFDFIGFFIGLLQIYITAKIIVWSIVMLYDRMHNRR
jgi:O-antigen/teichoic acid export membrane protein